MQAQRIKPVFVFEHKMIKEEIETLKHIYFDNMTMISPEPGYYKSFRIHLFPIQDEKSELTYLVLHFHLEEQYPEQIPKIEIADSGNIKPVERNDILQNLFDLSLRLNGRAMLFELINKAQLILSDLHQKSQESLANENKLYEEMLRNQKAKLAIVEQEREQAELDKMKQKENEKRKIGEFIDLMNMDEDKENKLRLQWLNERENEDSEGFYDDKVTDNTRKSAETFPIPEKDLLLINTIKSLALLIAKLKGFSPIDYICFLFKELKKMNLVENPELFRLAEKKTSGKYEKLLSEKLGKYKEGLQKGFSESKYDFHFENFLCANATETSFEEFSLKKQDFYLDYSSQNPASGTLFSKTVSTSEEKQSSTDNVALCGKPAIKSRYLVDFEEIASIGKGSFGEVIKARNRLDGRYYAIKKIKIYQGNFLKKIMREVQTLSLMHHHYVLRYYQAWIEEAESEIEKIDQQNVIDDEEFSEDNEDQYDSNSFYNTSSLKFNFSSTNRSATNDKQHEKVETNNKKILILYIQTEFCQKSLRDLIREGDIHKDPTQIWRLFHQILEGLQYIHGQKIIHRDLKPENIFIDSSNDIKIGDFGLAKSPVVPVEISSVGRNLLNATEEMNIKELEMMDQLEKTKKFGTFFYRSPELDSDQRHLYNHKVDIYSLAVIFFELWYPFKNRHERIKVLTQLRYNERMPKKFEELHARQAKITHWLLERDPKRRPSVYEILGSELLPPKMEDEYIKDAIKTISNPNTSYYKQIVQAIFRNNNILSIEIEKILDIRDFSNGLTTLSTKELVSLMHSRGVIELKTPILMDPTKSMLKARVQQKLHQEGGKNNINITNPGTDRLDEIVSFLNNEGNIVYLRKDLREGFKRGLQSLNKTLFMSKFLRKYEIGEVFQKNTGTQTIHSRWRLEYDDISLWDEGSYAFSETIKFSLELMERFDLPITRIRINHSVFQDEFFKAIGVNNKKLKVRILEILRESQESSWTTHALRQKLNTELKQLDRSSIEKILSFFGIKGSVAHCKKAILGYFFNNQTIEETFEVLEDIVSNLAEFYSLTKRVVNEWPYLSFLQTTAPEIMLDLTIKTKSAGFKSGFLYVIDVKDMAEDMVFGGTYPVNEKMLCKGDLDEASEDVRKGLLGCGFNVELEGLNRYLLRRKQMAGKNKEKTTKSNTKENINKMPSVFYKIEALICSVGLNVLEAKLKFLMVCQLNSLPAMIFSYENVNHSLESQIEFAEKHEINILIIIKEKVYPQKQKALIKTRNTEILKYKIEKEYNIEEFSAFISRMYKPSKKQLIGNSNNNTVKSLF